MYYELEKGDLKSAEPQRIGRCITRTDPTVVSVRTQWGDELTITDVSIDVRADGIHIILDCPEAIRIEP